MHPNRTHGLAWVTSFSSTKSVASASSAGSKRSRRTAQMDTLAEEPRTRSISVCSAADGDVEDDYRVSARAALLSPCGPGLRHVDPLKRLEQAAGDLYEMTNEGEDMATEGSSDGYGSGAQSHTTEGARSAASRLSALEATEASANTRNVRARCGYEQVDGRYPLESEAVGAATQNYSHQEAISTLDHDRESAALVLARGFVLSH
jgi:hypothetical protein